MPVADIAVLRAQWAQDLAVVAGSHVRLNGRLLSTRILVRQRCEAGTAEHDPAIRTGGLNMYEQAYGPADGAQAIPVGSREWSTMVLQVRQAKLRLCGRAAGHPQDW